MASSFGGEKKEGGEAGRAGPPSQAPRSIGSAGAAHERAVERYASEPHHRAEDLIYEAWAATAPRRAVLAREALALWPDCADAYVLLAQAASSLEEARELFEQGVAAGERELWGSVPGALAWLES